MTQNFVPVWLKRAIEEELRRYPITKAICKEAREEILYSSSRENIGVKPSGVSDPTYTTAARLCSETIIRLEWFCRAIEDVYEILDQEQRSIVRMYYFRRYKNYEVASQLGISESTLWRMRQDIVWLIAYRMGLLRPGWANKIGFSRDKCARILKEKPAKEMLR